MTASAALARIIQAASNLLEVQGNPVSKPAFSYSRQFTTRVFDAQMTIDANGVNVDILHSPDCAKTAHQHLSEVKPREAIAAALRDLMEEIRRCPVLDHPDLSCYLDLRRSNAGHLPAFLVVDGVDVGETSNDSPQSIDCLGHILDRALKELSPFPKPTATSLYAIPVWRIRHVRAQDPVSAYGKACALIWGRIFSPPKTLPHEDPFEVIQKWGAQDLSADLNAQLGRALPAW